jgi:putative transposase
VRQRVAYARELVAEGHSPSALARVLQISRQAIYRIPTRPPVAVSRSRPAVDEVERAIVQVAEQNPTDGYRIVTAWVNRKLGRAVNRKRVLRVMRERKLLQRRTREPRRRRPGFFKVQRPGQLWHLDMTSIWVAEHGWVYLNAIIDCCTREIVGWELSLRGRAVEAIAVIETAVREQGIRPGTLTLGTDNGSAFTARATRLVLSGLGVAHRRGGYRDPESQAFIESWFRYLKERCVWRHEFETLDQAREVIATYIAHYHHRPHSRLNYRTPTEVRQTWDDAQDQLQKQAA